MSTELDTVVATTEQMLPALAAAVAATNPQAASIAALAPIAMQLMQSAMQLHSAGAMSPDSWRRCLAQSAPAYRRRTISGRRSTPSRPDIG
jgi:hypothetical protein